MFTDADNAALYDLLNPWDPVRWPADAFYDSLVMAAESVLDVGCGTGAMLHRARDQGHPGRLVGIDPDRAALARARRRTDIEWIEGTAADVPADTGFALATMVSHAFQCLVTDDDLRNSLAAVRAALRPGGRFAFETRHPQVHAWQDWNPSNAVEIDGPDGRPLRVWHQVDSLVDDLVTFTTTTAVPGGAVLRADRTVLRFLDVPTLDAFLTDAGFQIESRYGDWQRGPLTVTSREIVTIARHPTPGTGSA